MSNDRVGKKLRINGVALTQSGKELFRIVQVEPIDNYSKALAQFFEGKRVSDDRSSRRQSPCSRRKCWQSVWCTVNIYHRASEGFIAIYGLPVRTQAAEQPEDA